MTGTANFNLPIMTVSGAGNYLGLISDLPKLTLSADGITGNVSFAEFPLTILTLLADGLSGETGDAAFSLPILVLSGSGLESGLGSATFDLPIVSLFADGVSGNVGDAIFALPILTLAGSGLHNIIGTAAFNLPILFLDARGEPTLGSAYRTWVMNLRKGGVTEYNNFNFNSYAQFNGYVLACGPSGVVILGLQDLDNATPISSLWRTGAEEFDVSVHKRIPRLYLDGTQSGDLYFRTRTVEGGTRTYLLKWNNISGQTQRRVPVGKGPRSRFWQFECENVNGSDFSTMSLMAYPTKLHRRVS